MKTGKELIEYIKQAEPLQRAEILINEIDPYLHKGISLMDGPILTREEAISIYISRAVELFECPEAEIEKGFNEYGYFLPFEIFNKYYYDHDRHHFIVEVSRIICEKNAKSLFTDLVKKEIDSKIEEYERANLPISEAVSKIKEKYEFWSKIPKPSQDMTTYYCWIDFIEPYLKDREGPEDSKFTVGSVIIAFFYMYKKAFYPFPEITQNGKRMEFYRKLAEKYSVSVNSLKNDWNLLQNKDCRIKRPESISLAIEILKTFNDPKVSEAIDLAKAELREAELKS